ncbi:MAG TPA: LytTR family DNA-binding domain-containing protein [Fibrobacteraceae bacterium]|nr:LytTR family DNA-binding domain-containing protein [Fibrobacteraceae bacterium]
MDSVSCLIVDDEPLALDLLESYVRKTPFLQLQGRASSAQQAMELMQSNQVDLLFLDIQMPGLSGTEFARTLRNGPRVIFSTAFAKYAVEGFRLDAVDYLLKPYDYTEFLRATQKAKEAITLAKQANASNSNAAQNAFFFVKSEYRLVRIDVDRILYIEGMKDYAKIFLEGEPKPVITLMSLKSLLEKLPSRTFLRVHRSYIIHLTFVQSLEKGEAVICGVHIPIADKYKSLIDKHIQGL